ncbi:DUF1707 SHOCT-like domain-containing protein [Kitasatospora sp. CB01950]|uniref:DUF1707 SHOCT-like domain-containing protein n=1 Tax=Kitasatospora sp. CB01950 TaxID=1703930 RepID=UPI000938BA31|nr:DUF1707 domain-containing protein [Kitasatospora sp. CB01950]OKJ11857.1 hypothetical protein AMK19_13590 [Kitasatospora sp. CB01950]
MTSLPDSPQTRVGAAERDAAAERLQQAYAEERITHEEMEQRLQQALTATTRTELDLATADLPASPSDDDTATIATAGGRIVRRGAWRVPRTLKVASAFGKVRLDLSHAIIEHQVVDIELGLGFGRATITVPHNATVDVDGVQGGWQDVRYRPPRHAVPGGPLIRITGAPGFGRLRVRHARSR